MTIGKLLRSVHVDVQHALSHLTQDLNDPITAGIIVVALSSLLGAGFGHAGGSVLSAVVIDEKQRSEIKKGCSTIGFLAVAAFAFYSLYPRK